jgi:tRNA(fMet)-specific endonuclease VapC
MLGADVIIRGEKGDFDLDRWFASHPSDQFEVAAITIAELWHGIERASPPHRLRRQQFLQAVIDALPVIPYTEQTAYHHARIWAMLAASGTLIGPYDLIVAATAIERGSTVATFNQKHFSSVEGLRILRPKLDS